MTWQQLLKTLKERGYKGADNDLGAVKAFCDANGLDIQCAGKAVDLDALHTKAHPPKQPLSMDAAVAADEIDRKVEEKFAALKDLDDDLSGRKKAGERGEKNHGADLGSIRVGKDRLEDDPKGGFHSLGNFIQHVFRVGGTGERPFDPPADSPLLKWQQVYGRKVLGEAEANYKAGFISKATLSTYSNETSGADGGFAIPPEFRAGINNRVMAETSIIALCDKATLSGNTLTAVIDETTPWQTTGGILCYWGGEATAITQSKLALKERTFRLRKLFALVPMTEELASDAGFLSSYIPNKAGDKLSFAADLAVLSGTGVAQPQGVIGHAGTVSVAKETNQTAATIKASNIQKMWMAMLPEQRRRAIWIVNADCQVQLQRMFVQGTKDSNTFVAAGGLVYLPANGLAGAPNDTIMGRPILYHQACATLGTVGDIILFDPMSYLVCTKATAVESASSIHLWFDQAVNALRFLYRIDGQPWWPTTVAALNGTGTYGSFVTLATRA